MENIHKYSNISIHPENSQNSVEIQKILFELGIIWYSQKDFNESPKILYEELNDIVLCVNLLEKHITKIDSLSKYLSFKNEPYLKEQDFDPKLYKFKDIYDIKNIILYGHKKPNYYSKNKHKRILEFFNNKNVLLYNEKINNMNDTVILIYCKNREESLELEDFLHINNYMYAGEQFYIIKNTIYHTDITFVLNIDNNIKIFSAYSGIKDTMTSYKPNFIFLKYYEYKTNIKNFILNPTYFTFININAIKPTYEPKQKIIREFKVFEGLFHSNYNYDTIVVAINNIDELNQTNEYLKKTFNININYDYILSELTLNRKKYIRFIYHRYDIDYKHGDLNNIDFNLRNTKYEKIYHVKDLLNDLIQQILMTGKYVNTPIYNPKSKIKRTLD